MLSNPIGLQLIILKIDMNVGLVQICIIFSLFIFMYNRSMLIIDHYLAKCYVPSLYSHHLLVGSQVQYRQGSMHVFVSSK